MTAILGISAFYHDSAAALVVDGEIVAAAQEERFTRKKHDYNFPTKAIEFCLLHAELQPGQLDYVGFYDKPFLKAVTTLQERCRGIRLVSVLFSSEVPSPPNDRLWSKFTVQLKDPLNLREVLQDPSFFLDGSRLNAKGHAFVADHIFQKIQGLVKGTSVATTVSVN